MKKVRNKMPNKKPTDVTDIKVGKMTDSEIIKALECCKYEYDTKCELCCYNFYSRTGCRSELNGYKRNQGNTYMGTL